MNGIQDFTTGIVDRYLTLDLEVVVTRVLEGGKYINRLAAHRLASGKRGNLALMHKLATLDCAVYRYIHGGEDIHRCASCSPGLDIDDGIPPAVANILGNMNTGSHILRNAGLQME